MLTLQLCLGDADEKCSTLGKRVQLGRGYLEAFESSQITMSVVETENRKQIWVGENADPGESDPNEFSHRNDYRKFLGFEGIRILICAEDGRVSVEITRTAAGTCPIYVALHETTLVASWKFEDAVNIIPNPKPNAEACKLYMQYGQCQVRDMVIHGVFMLWPGEFLVVDHNGLEFTEADVPEIVLPGTLTVSAKATDEFLYLIADSIRHNLVKANAPLLELSGGFDSACVAVAACSLRNGMNSYAVIQQGAMGVQQRNRRRELIDLLKVNDFEAPSFEPPPFASLKVEECTLTPFDDMYRLPCVYAVDAHPAKGIDLLVTGIGGDELTMEDTFLSRQDWEVSGSVCGSAIVSAVGRADMFMRRGIWPVHPLVNQVVVDFCRALPQGMRAGRALNILALARAGLSDGFLYPRYFEHYGHVIQHEAALFDFDGALVESVLADYRLAELSTLLARAREATLHGFSYKLITELYHLLKLEAVLRRYVS